MKPWQKRSLTESSITPQALKILQRPNGTDEDSIRFEPSESAHASKTTQPPNEKNGTNKGNEKLPPMNTSAPHGLTQSLQEEPPPRKTNGASAKTSQKKKLQVPMPVSAEELLTDDNLVEPEPIIDNLLYPGVCMAAGRPKVGKSWLALHTAPSLVACRLETISIG
jgi:hypothetical protein